MWQESLVALLVLASFGVAIWKLMPARRRLQALLAVDRWAAKRPGLARWRVRSLAPRIARAAGPGCAGCAANVSGRPPAAPRR